MSRTLRLALGLVALLLFLTGLLNLAAGLLDALAPPAPE